MTAPAALAAPATQTVLAAQTAPAALAAQTALAAPAALADLVETQAEVVETQAEVVETHAAPAAQADVVGAQAGAEGHIAVDPVRVSGPNGALGGAAGQALVGARARRPVAGRTEAGLDWAGDRAVGWAKALARGRVAALRHRVADRAVVVPAALLAVVRVVGLEEVPVVVPADRAVGRRKAAGRLAVGPGSGQAFGAAGRPEQALEVAAAAARTASDWGSGRPPAPRRRRRTELGRRAGSHTCHRRNPDRALAAFLDPGLAPAELGSGDRADGAGR